MKTILFNEIENFNIEDNNSTSLMHFLIGIYSEYLTNACEVDASDALYPIITSYFCSGCPVVNLLDKYYKSIKNKN